MINLYNNAGVLNARLAQADNIATMAHGVANSAGLAGARIEIYWARALLDSVGSLTLGTVYYLSPATGGAVQNVKPAVPGQIVQPIGLALTSGALLMDIPLNPQTL